ncbi:hypothetical protein GJ496_002427 [Pomphorhynchus laevis]|nr:hypothetical protein GJ496_002427 [Pomphorhynchus laevis]
MLTDEKICEIKSAIEQSTLEFVSNLSENPSQTKRCFTFLGYRSKNQKHIARYIYLVSVIQELIYLHSTMTKRDIYYRQLDLFPNVSCIESLVKRFCTYFKIDRWYFHYVSSTSKSVAFGPVQIYYHMKDNWPVDFNVNQKGTLIPACSAGHITKVNCELVDCVLVVEKDAIFQYILNVTNSLENMPRWLLCTGKGYPDWAIRYLLKGLVDSNPNLPVYMLADCDPDGFEIYNCYKSEIPDNLHWIGLWPSELSVNMNKIPLTNRDIRKLQCQIKRTKSASICKELEIMMQSGQKAELESLYSIHPNYLINDYLFSKLKNGRWY